MFSARALVLAFALASAPVTTAWAAPADVATAVASTSRSADNVKLDAGRKPAELLKFLGLQKNMVKTSGSWAARSILNCSPCWMIT